MKKIALITLFTILSTSTIFAMEEKENTDCKNMVQSSAQKSLSQTDSSAEKPVSQETNGL